jgi:4-hydroxy-4-methyl-2-oxoglutarate aldolase
MLEDPPLLTINRRFERPPQALTEAFAGAITSHIVDAQQGRGTLDHRIKAVPGAPAGMRRFCGPAVTCWCGPNDNLGLFGALAEAKPGDVLMCATEGFEHGAVAGDLLIGMAKNRGVAAIVTDGVVRDLDEIIAIGLPVFARGITANSCIRSGPGKVGFPVTMAGVAVAPGDLVVGDVNGVVVVPRATLEEVRGRLVQVQGGEAAMEAKVKAGLELPGFIEELLASPRTRFLE